MYTFDHLTIGEIVTFAANAKPNRTKIILNMLTDSFKSFFFCRFILNVEDRKREKYTHTHIHA